MACVPYVTTYFEILYHLILIFKLVLWCTGDIFLVYRPIAISFLQSFFF